MTVKTAWPQEDVTVLGPVGSYAMQTNHKPTVHSSSERVIGSLKRISLHRVRHLVPLRIGYEMPS